MDENENNNDIEIVVDNNGDDLDISPVYGHLNVAKPNPQEKREEIIIPEIKETTSDENHEDDSTDDESTTEDENKN